MGTRRWFVIFVDAIEYPSRILYMLYMLLFFFPFCSFLFETIRREIHLTIDWIARQIYTKKRRIIECKRIRWKIILRSLRLKESFELYLDTITVIDYIIQFRSERGQFFFFFCYYVHELHAPSGRIKCTEVPSATRQYGESCTWPQHTQNSL